MIVPAWLRWATTELVAAMREFHRVRRPHAFGVVYQVIIGPARSDGDARWFVGQEMGLGETVNPPAPFATIGCAAARRLPFPLSASSLAFGYGAG